MNEMGKKLKQNFSGFRLSFPCSMMCVEVLARKERERERVSSSPIQDPICIQNCVIIISVFKLGESHPSIHSTHTYNTQFHNRMVQMGCNHAITCLQINRRQERERHTQNRTINDVQMTVMGFLFWDNVYTFLLLPSLSFCLIFSLCCLIFSVH
jgi:hypothetical protein